MTAPPTATCRGCGAGYIPGSNPDGYCGLCKALGKVPDRMPSPLTWEMEERLGLGKGPSNG